MGKILTVLLLFAVVVIMFPVKGAVLSILSEAFRPRKKGRQVMRLSELSFWAVIAGFAIFFFDWSGYDKWQPSLFFPKDLKNIWWHLPLEIAGVFVILRLFSAAAADANKGDG